MDTSLDLDEDDPPANCIEMSQDGDGTSGSSERSGERSGYDNRVSTTSESSCKIEIIDVGHDGSSNFTTSCLRMCKKQVLRPYWNLLIFIGWRGFNRESVHAHTLGWRLINIFYTTVIISLLLYSYSYEVLACEWKLDIATDALPFTPDIPEDPTITTTTVSPTTEAQVLGPEFLDRHYSPDDWSTLRELVKAMNMKKVEENVTSSAPPKHKNPACDHIVTTYLLPCALHLLAYVIGFYYFRVQESEQLDALMEKVFLQATTVQARAASQHNMIKTQRQFLWFGGLWVFLSGMLQCLYMWAFDFPTMPLFNKVRMGEEIVLFTLEVFGRIVFNSVILAIVVNFVTQCEMIKFYVKGLVMRLQEKSTCLKTAMKDVLTLRQSLSQLNGLISKMTSLVGVILAELTVIGIFLLFMNKNNSGKMWAYRALFPTAWASMFALPLYQAARVNSICLRIHKVALEMRVFGYKGASLLDLDSFMQFVTNTKLRAKLFHVTMVPSQLIFSSIVVAFVLLVLIQTSHITPTSPII